MTDEQTAAAIVADSMNAVSETAMEAAIVRALQAARTPPHGHIIDDAGVVRKVYCKTPRYGFWQLDEQDEVKVVDVMQQEFTKPQREAAEAAKEAQ